MPLSAANLANQQRDEWRLIGNPLFATGVSRGTTTASGVFSVDVGKGAYSGIDRIILFAIAYDEATQTRVTATGGGPYQTKGTFWDFQPLTPNGRTARWRVRRNSVSAGGTLSTMTLASSTTAVTAKWFAVGY